MGTKLAGEMWLSLEQVSQVLGVPWFTVWRWARDGDPRLPAYRFWSDSFPRQGSFRYRKQDLEALQTRPPESAMSSVAERIPSPRPRARRAAAA